MHDNDDDNDDDNGHAHDADGGSDQLDGSEDANDAICDEANADYANY